MYYLVTYLKMYLFILSWFLKKKKKKVFCFSYFIWEVLGLHTEH